jgi:NTE family protein
MFKPLWVYENPFSDPNYFSPSSGHIYDHSHLIITLEKYIDYDKLKPDGSPNSWLILTAVHILTAAPLTFDSSKQQITPKHVLATSSYQF